MRDGAGLRCGVGEGSSYFVPALTVRPWTTRSVGAEGRRLAGIRGDCRGWKWSGGKGDIPRWLDRVKAGRCGAERASGASGESTARKGKTAAGGLTWGTNEVNHM
jgi:hypothetical protein